MSVIITKTMGLMTSYRKPRVFVDADALFAGVASPSENGASLVTLRLAEITLIDALTSQQVIVEAERNLTEKLPHKLPEFRLIVSRCLQVVPNPQPDELIPYKGAADTKDLPILIAAVREHCPYLITFNIKHFQPGHETVKVLRPGDFVLAIRDKLSHSML